ncbi:hypothetical protein DMENIID0001_019370 [Sergentomyia squamirostris]
MALVEKFVVVILLAGVVLSDEPKPKGMKFEKFEVSPGSEKYFTYDLKIEEVNETAFKMSMDMEQLEDIDNTWDTQMSIHFSPKNDGKYEVLFESPKEKVCDYMKGEIYKDHIYPAFKDISNMPAPEECPVKKGTYKIDEHIFNAKELEMGKVGGWIIDELFYKDGQMVSETKTYFTVF